MGMLDPVSVLMCTRSAVTLTTDPMLSLRLGVPMPETLFVMRTRSPTLNLVAVVVAVVSLIATIRSIKMSSASCKRRNFAIKRLTSLDICA